MNKKRILFVQPDYHCSFFYKQELKKRGYQVNIFVSNEYNKKLLYSNDAIIHAYNGNYKFVKLIYNILYFVKFMIHYDLFIIYAQNHIVNLLPYRLEKLFAYDFKLDLFLAKILGKKLIYIPSGCLDANYKEIIEKYDNGAICNNCGYNESTCNNKIIKSKVDSIRKYFDLVITYTDMDYIYKKNKVFKYKVLDLDKWNPNVVIPQKYQQNISSSIKILHSFFDNNRQNNSRNIKGSPYIVDAIERLKTEGYNVEYFYVNDVPSNEMIYYQAQADIVVDQLIYGWWGSTTLECLALGKPVVCYLREDAKKRFFDTFSEYPSLPVIEANINNIYEILKTLVVDEKYRKEKSLESRKFAESFLNIEKNTDDLINTLDKL